jgi:hypothetical protein
MGSNRKHRDHADSRDRHPLDAYGMAAGSPASYQFSEVGMITLGELERLAKESLWTGDWNASCGTVDCAYSADSKFAGEFDEIAHPVPNGVSDYIAAAQPKAILELVGEVRRLQEDAADWKRRWQDAVDQASSLTIERNHWQANHDNQVSRARFLIERGDIPVERVLAYEDMGRLQEDAKRLDFYEANLNSDVSREGIYSVWMGRGWGDEFTGSTFREAIDAARAKEQS